MVYYPTKPVTSQESESKLYPTEVKKKILAQILAQILTQILTQIVTQIVFFYLIGT